MEAVGHLRGARAPWRAPSAYALARSRAITSTPGCSRSHCATGSAVRPGAAPRAGGAPGPPGSCHRCAVCAGRSHPPQHPGRGERRGRLLAEHAGRVARLITTSHAWPSCTPAFPKRPAEGEQALSEPQRAARPGATTVGKRSVKMRRRQARLRQTICARVDGGAYDSRPRTDQ